MGDFTGGPVGKVQYIDFPEQFRFWRRYRICLCKALSYRTVDWSLRQRNTTMQIANSHEVNLKVNCWLCSSMKLSADKPLTKQKKLFSYENKVMPSKMRRIFMKKIGMLVLECLSSFYNQSIISRKWSQIVFKIVIHIHEWYLVNPMWVIILPFHILNY